jgi:hypothetical protein
VRLSNLFNAQSVEIGAVHVALRSNGAEIAAGTDRTLLFTGREAVTIPPNAIVFSDLVKLTVRPDSDAAISIYIP